MTLLLLLIAGQAEEIVLQVREARPATPWTEVVSASCGDQHVEVRRPMRPLSAPAQVFLNGVGARGDMRPLEEALGQVGAAYRMSVQCSQDSETVLLNWVAGLADGQGEVSYRAGYAEFREGALIEARSGEANEETFWYR